jgi:predicted nucleic acid-binding protein
MKKAFIDSDVIFDLLQVLHPFHEDAHSLFALIEQGKLKGLVSPVIFANLFYILRKDHGNKGAVDRLIRLKMLLKIVKIGERTIELALSSSFTDFEDAIQYFAAVESKSDCLVTRNKRDYKDSKIPVFLPSELLHILET